jgi:hypothetical protein
VKDNPCIEAHVKNKHYVMYSPYEIADFIAEAYFIAYEAFLHHPNNLERVFWTRYKIRCNALANTPHGNCFIDASELSIDKECESIEFIDSIDENTYISVINKALNTLTPSQRQLCRIITFAKEPVATEFLAKAFQITPSAMSQRISAIVKKLNAHKKLYGAFYDSCEIL